MMSSASRPVVIVPYRAEWATEFAAIGRELRARIGGDALRIDHIGSTAVPGLGAKDVIDVQVTVADLDDTDGLVRRLRDAGYRERRDVETDLFASLAPHGPELRKRYLREPDGRRRVHVHLREAGRFNQRFALLFRDYLRSVAGVRIGYEQAKQRAAEVYPHDIDRYLRLKEPVFRLIYEAAAQWAQLTGWQPGADHL